MKKTAIKWIMILALALLQNAFAGNEINGIGIGAVVALPSGDLSNFAGTGFGGIGTLRYEFNKDISLTGSIGYVKFGGKEFSFFATEGYKYNYAVIPIMTGGRYYLMPEDAGTRFHVGGQLGYHIYTVSLDTPDGGSTLASASGTSNFALVPTVGVELGAIDITAHYTLADFSNIGIQVGFLFSK